MFRPANRRSQAGQDSGGRPRRDAVKDRRNGNSIGGGTWHRSLREMPHYGMVPEQSHRIAEPSRNHGSGPVTGIRFFRIPGTGHGNPEPPPADCHGRGSVALDSLADVIRLDHFMNTVGHACCWLRFRMMPLRPCSTS